MKIFIPRNVSRGRFNMNVSVGPFSVSIVQLLILAVGLGLTLAIWNGLTRTGTGKVAALLLALPIFLLCAFIAFFKYSELTLVPFIAKLVRTYFLDATQKFQLDREKPDPVKVAITKARKTDHEQVIKQKDLVIDEERLEKLKNITEEK